MSIQILERDLKIQHIKGSGPGGQHRNKRETGIRITHLPTGIVAVATEERSQAMNLEAAMGRIRLKLEKAFAKRKRRKKTAVPGWARSQRLKQKRIRSERKELRKPVG